MTISMFRASVPVCIRMLGNLAGILEKGATYRKEKDVDEAVLVNARLFPDMFPLSRQVQIACDIAKRGAARLARLSPDVQEDTETSFPELLERVRGVISFLETVEPGQIDGTEEKAITFKLRGEDVTFDGETYLLSFILPNVYFHITTAYNILRHNGVVLGKRDYLGQL